MGFDFREGFAIHTADPTGAGVVLAMPLPPRGRSRRFDAHARWERIAAHIAAGFRIHRRAVNLTLDAEAVLVRVLVQRAAPKLGGRTRAQLEQKAAAFRLEQPPEPQPGPPTRPG